MNLGIFRGHKRGELEAIEWGDIRKRYERWRIGKGNGTFNYIVNVSGVKYDGCCR